MTVESRLRLARAADEAALGLRDRDGDLLAGQQLLERDRQIGPLLLRLSQSDAGAERELGIDAAGSSAPSARDRAQTPAASASRRTGRRPCSPRSFRIGKLISCMPGMRRQLRQRILHVRADAQERHAPRPKLIRQLLHPRAIQLGDRALRPQEINDDRLLLGEVGQRVRLAAKILQREIVDLAAEERLRRILRCLGACRERRGTGQPKQQARSTTRARLASYFRCSSNQAIASFWAWSRASL